MYINTRLSRYHIGINNTHCGRSIDWLECGKQTQTIYRYNHTCWGSSSHSITMRINSSVDSNGSDQKSFACRDSIDSKGIFESVSVNNTPKPSPGPDISDGIIWILSSEDKRPLLWIGSILINLETHITLIIWLSRSVSTRTAQASKPVISNVCVSHHPAPQPTIFLI